MKIVFVSNYYNHHQAPTAEEWVRLSGGEFYFVSTTEVPLERQAIGYQKDNFPDFVILAYQNEEMKQKSIRVINEADVVMIGSAPDEYIQQRLKEKKLVFRCQERPYKMPWDAKKAWRIRLKHFWLHKRHKNLYLLCCSAYTAGDYAKTKTFLGKAYKWGYFPKVKKYHSIQNVMEVKRSSSILWVGRFMGWKHPELAIQLAQRLKEEGDSFTLKLIGDGEMKQTLQQMIDSQGLSDCVQLLGSMRPEEVRKHMEESQIFLFTSDRNEGWGAVLNEAMNSGCAVVANKAIGAVPYLLEHNKNGLIYKGQEELYQSVKMLLDQPEKAEQFGRAAYRTMVEYWNAEVAAGRFLQLATQLIQGDNITMFEEGPCSKAPIITE